MERTPEKKEKISQGIKKSWEERKQKEQAQGAPDYKALYTAECAKTKALENKVIEFEKLCKAYAERERQANSTLQRATLEYNARVKYMIDCIRHAYLSVQLAENASEQKKGGAQ